MLDFLKVDTYFYIVGGILVLGVLIGLSLMSRVKTARAGNALSAVCAVAAILLTMVRNDILPDWAIWLSIAVGVVVSLIGAAKVKMIQMPQVVALLNGLGGLASALVAILSVWQADTTFSFYVSRIALVVGFLTFTGSLVAAGKLHKLLPQKPVVWKGHTAIIAATIVLTVVSVVLKGCPVWVAAVLSAFFGVAFAIRVGGADMPITISLLNSLSGVAGGIAGIAVGDMVLVALGGIVGASGLLLTQIMCKAMNRKLLSILLGSTSVKAPQKVAQTQGSEAVEEAASAESALTPGEILRSAKKVIIIPGYGMALAQAQQAVKTLADKLESKGAEVKFAIHPVAGRMPGHMNVLLCEVDVPYDKLYEMDAINDEFDGCDAVVIIGANDVVNPAANTAEGTPIYGMPVLNAAAAKHILVCNFDRKPGYAGVPNPLYDADNAVLLLGDAKQTVASLIDALDAPQETGETAPAAQEDGAADPGAILKGAKKVIIIPGYGMALAQAQQTVKTLADKLESQGVEVKFAIHPVAGRMPGHMNVLLCEVDVPYDKLYEMDAINGEFDGCDAVVIVGANDVVNPAANTAEGTPIYGMPVLNAAAAKHVIICNFDRKPGYAGVPNPLYDADNAVLLLGDAKETVASLLSALDKAPAQGSGSAEKADNDPGAILKNAKRVIIVPGYGMALAQAQRTVKQLADKLEAAGVQVKFAIHPVAGRMPGHMNVLLCEVDVPYDQLYEMDAINGEFAQCDAVIIVGANDVVNPAANTAEGTPIYGMPVLNVTDAAHVIVCNFDDKPGYAGVPNPLYADKRTILLLGDAKDTVAGLIASL